MNKVNRNIFYIWLASSILLYVFVVTFGVILGRVIIKFLAGA